MRGGAAGAAATQQNQIYVQACDRPARAASPTTAATMRATTARTQLLQQQIKASEGLRQAGDLMVAAFFDAPKPKERARQAASLPGDAQRRLRRRRPAGCDSGDPRAAGGGREGHHVPFTGIWSFRRCLVRSATGFDVFVGNPPFAGKNTHRRGQPDGILDWFKQLIPRATAMPIWWPTSSAAASTCCGPVDRWA